MKKLLAFLVACLMPIGLIAGSGDVNGDGKVDKEDLSFIINFIMNSPQGSYDKKADVNNDGAVNAADIVTLINEAEGESTPNSLVLLAKNGKKAVYKLTDNPKVTFTESELVITSKGSEKKYPMSNMSRITYEKNDGTTLNIDEINNYPEGADGTGDVLYFYRNDDHFNAFFHDEVISIEHSYEDADGETHDNVINQIINTSDSIYLIPLTAIDSVSFITPPTSYKKDVIRLDLSLLDYIIGSDGLTLKLKPETPTMIIPVIGSKLVLLEGCDALPFGFSGIVSDVKTESSSIDVVCEEAYLEDLFDSFSNVSTVYGASTENASRAFFTSDKRNTTRATYSPNDVEFSLGPFVIDRSYELSQGFADDGDLALSGGASFSVEVKPTFKIHTFLILSEGQGTYFSYRITGDLQVKSQLSLYGGLSYNHDWDGLIASCPIPMTGNMVNFYINPGLFVRADATIASSITSTQNYTFGSAFDYSSKGNNTIKPSIGGRLAGSSVDMSGSLDGSYAGGAYIETGFNLLSRKIAKVCVRGELGVKIVENFVLRNSDIESASKDTKLYERLKASNVEISSFVNVSLQASVAHTGNGLRWELSAPILKRDLVPKFSNTKLEKTSNSKNSVDAETELSGDCLFPVSIGYKLFDENKNEVANYDAKDYYYDAKSYTNKDCKMDYTFVGLDEDNLYGYKVYPKVKLFGFDVLASPGAGLQNPTSCPDNNHPHWIDLGLPSGTQWRCCNEGASAPEDYGGYYTFSYKVASKPTFDQIREMLSSCSYTWTTLNGVWGGKFTGPNGGIIFLPAAGLNLSSVSIGGVGSVGYYWSSTRYDYPQAYHLKFNSGEANWGIDLPHDGLSLRPVR